MLVVYRLFVSCVVGCFACLPAVAADSDKETVEATITKALADLPGDTACAFTEIRDGRAVVALRRPR